MTHANTSAASHPIQPYASARKREHEDALIDSALHRSVAGLLHSQAQASAKTGRITVIRRAGPSVPFASVE